MDYLTVKEVAELKGCTARYIQKLADIGKIQTIQEINQQNNKMQYMIPISALPADLQAKHYQKVKKDAGVLPELKKPIKQPKNVVKKAFEELSPPVIK